jgi:hypothetical protein
LPALRRAAATARHSFTVVAIGTVQAAFFPASSAAIDIEAWAAMGVTT